MYTGANQLTGDGDREANSARVSSHKNFRDIINGIYLKPSKGAGSGAQNMTGPTNGIANFYQNDSIMVQSKPSQTSTPNLNLMHTGVTNKPLGHNGAFDSALDHKNKKTVIFFLGKSQSKLARGFTERVRIH